MILQIFFLAIFIVKLDSADPHPVQVSDAVIEIEKQRLVKFPDEIELQQDSTANSSDSKNSKIDEAQRILQEIEKINHSLGYIRKQSEPSRLPPILDSSQYLFPKPAVQPFHQQNHETSGMNGGTILIPSIRSVALPRQYITSYSISKGVANIGPLHQLQTAKDSLTKNNKYVLQPNEVVLSSPDSAYERRELPTHFAIPVRLYRLNKEEYINKNSPQQFRVKGYNIVGDVGNFYGKGKRKIIETNETKAEFSTKYQLFFFPREVASLKDSYQDIYKLSLMRLEGKQKSQDNNSREEKGVGIQRPYKMQTAVASSSSDISSNANVTTQIIRKRVMPKPLREKESIISETSEQQILLEDTNSFNNFNNANTNSNMNANYNPTMHSNPSQNSNLYNERPGILKFPNIINLARPSDQKNTTPGNSIKNAFQSIFKLPFLQDSKPSSNMTTGDLGQALHISANPFFTTQANQQTQTLYDIIGTKQPQKGSDYQWEDEASSSASEDEEITSTEHEEKHIFGNHQNGELKTQLDAVKQGGIIIQRLKVRKGGIAIAGPGGVATAGSGGTAIVGPGGYALTHPRSLTIAGPGAKVIAIPSSVDLKEALQRTNLHDQIIPHEGKVVATGPTVYYSPPTQHAHNPSILKEYSYPYYGGLRGQILQVVRTKDGQDNMFIISPTSIPNGSIKSISTTKGSFPISEDDDQLNNKSLTSIAFEQDFNRIQIAAARLVAIQEVAKRKGSFSVEDNRIYAESLLELGRAAQNLANLHETGQIKDFSLLLQPDFQVPHKKPLFPLESVAESEVSNGEQKVDEVTEQLFNEEDLLPPNTEDPYEDVSDTIAVTAPKKDASVAEAKPIGLSIAGEGGVASSKPNAIALSGRNGLAVSAPKATAIAGVSAEEAAAFSVSIPNRNNLVIKNVNHLSQRPAYDDYNEDYSDVLPARSTFTRDTTVTHGSYIPVISKKTKVASVTEAGSDAGFADSLVKQWKTIIAEDYSALARSVPQLTPTKYVKEVSKPQQGSINKKA